MFELVSHIVHEAEISQDFTQPLPVPGWVYPIQYTLKEHGENDAQGNVEYLLEDVQINLNEESIFYHLAYRVLNETGIQAVSNVQASFDPSFQSVDLHKINVIRDGQVSEKLGRTKIYTLQREKDLERHLYDGSLSSCLFIDDVRENDIIEFSYTLKGFNPVFKPHFSQNYSMQYGAPLQKKFLRLIKMENKPISIKHHQMDVFPKIKSLGNNEEEWVWELNDIPSHEYESNEPSWSLTRPFLQISDYESWHDVAASLNRHYELPDKSQLPQEMQALAKKWDEENLSKKQKALAATRFVQDKIRYLGFEDGINGYKPRPAQLIFEKRFGDCKEKTQLLRSFLDLMSIESYPTLVHTEYGKSVKDFKPSHGVFNHVILTVVLDDHIYWVDPTMSLQGGSMDDLNYPDVSYGLVIKEDTKDLIQIPHPPSGKRQTTYTITFDDNRDAEIEILTIASGPEADFLRHSFMKKDKRDIAKSYQDDTSSIYGPVIPTDSFEIDDDREKNEIVIKESYYADKVLKKNDDQLSGEFSVYPQELIGFFRNPIVPVRNTPLQHAFPVHYIETYHIMDKEFHEVADKHSHYDNSAFNYSIQKHMQDGEAMIQFEFLSLKDHVMPEELVSHKELLQECLEHSFFTCTIHAPTDETESEASSEKPLNYVFGGAVSTIMYLFWIVFQGIQSLFI